jgi:hypothetical protein
VVEAEDKVRVIQANLKTAQSRQKSYFDKRRKPLQFEIGNHVYLKVSPIKGVQWFGVKGTLAPYYVGPYQIVEQCGPVAYRLKLPIDLAVVHDVFHVSHEVNPFCRFARPFVSPVQLQSRPSSRASVRSVTEERDSHARCSVFPVPVQA